MTQHELQLRMTLPQFPLSAKYDPAWVLENQMGPCALWLCEFLMEKMHLEPGMRVLDMGCGKGLTSVFLAREYGVTVFANDLWIPAGENHKRFCAAGLGDKIVPIHAEARQLPYADGFFDAIISIDSYEYYGTDALYLDYISDFLKPGGQIGIVAPGLTREFGDDGPPAHLLPHWDWSMSSFHSPGWWRRLWQLSRDIQVEVSDLLPNAVDLWQHWDEILIAAGIMQAEPDGGLLAADKDSLLTFTRVVGRKGEARW